jgi:hypothetical protein
MLGTPSITICGWQPHLVILDVHPPDPRRTVKPGNALQCRHHVESLVYFRLLDIATEADALP